MKRRQLGRALGLTAVVVIAAACTPSVIIHNSTSFGIVVTIVAGDKGDAFSPTAGESSTFQFEGGGYSVTAMPSAQWKTQMTQTRQALNALLADYTAHQVALTTDQVDQVLQKLKDIDLQLKQFADTPDSNKASCTGSVGSGSPEGGGANEANVEISQSADGSLSASCH